MSATAAKSLSPAQVDFDGERPVSRDFDDVYFDADGAAEVARVFLAPAAFEARTVDPGATFTVGELGFGTGLNFLVAAHAARCRLHFISVDLHPLAAADATRSLAPWARKFPLARDLVKHYPPLVPGWHRRLFEAGRIQLSVYFGDVREALRELLRQQRRGVDAWFLDGFAPRRNAAMWGLDLFEAMGRLSARRATVTTFTAAGTVRRDLNAAGFDVRRVDQRPHKRHSTTGVYTGAGRSFAVPGDAVVLGAGLAGTATAAALGAKGITARVMDGAGVAHGASGIPAAVMHPRLSPAKSTQSAFRLHAFAFAAHRCVALPGATAGGVLQLPGPTVDADRLSRIARSAPRGIAEPIGPESASMRTGVPIREPGLFFPGALTIDGRRLSAAFCEHANVEIVAPEPARSSPLVRATGPDTGTFDTIEVTRLGGQLDCFGHDRSPRLPIVGDGTIVPTRGGVWVGATYEYRPWPPLQATAANADRFFRFFGERPGTALERFRGVRAVTSDRLPVIGCDEGVWFNLGHGSHGTATAILGAEIVASAIAGEVAPITLDLLELVRPGRFRERQKRRPNPFSRPADRTTARS